MGIEDNGQLWIPMCRRWASVEGFGDRRHCDYLQHCFSALMRRNQIAVVGGGEDEAAASTYCLLEKYVRKCKVKIEWWLVGHEGH